MKKRFYFSNFLLLAIFLFSSSILWAQTTLTGKVTDEQGNALFNATVMVQGTRIGSYTDLDGVYKITNVPSGQVTLHASFLGYQFKTQSIEVNGQPEIKTDFELKSSTIQSGEFVVEATRARNNTPVTHQNIESSDFEQNNTGIDLPILLDQATAVVTASDAGTGVGYTSMRIRGTDQSRINVTINGVPVNDAESQGIFWVNMGDFASSVDNIQIQRGVGTSTNGGSAFGATVNLNTHKTNLEPYAGYDFSAGSFNTTKHTATFGTGLLKNKFFFDGRLSSVNSDGYIDRASADLKSYYLSGGYSFKKNTIRFTTFSGKERTYQAWNGAPQSVIDTNRTFNPYDYKDQVDNYQQTHYQLEWVRQLTDNLKVNLTLHQTDGRGYFEEYKGEVFNKTLGGSKQKFADYGFQDLIIGNDTIRRTNLVRRRWLDNTFQGVIGSIQYKKRNVFAVIGGGYNYYDGRHFGEVIWTEYASNSFIGDRYYDNRGQKGDFNIYGKIEYTLKPNITLFGDLQYRSVNYKVRGLYKTREELRVDDNLQFFNPKAGVSYRISRNDQVYASYAIGNREPNRDDYVDAVPGTTPKHESLQDFELGYSRRHHKYALKANVYYMNYKDQLVQTGAINDVGEGIKENVDKSHRTGVEVEFHYAVTKNLDWKLNFAYSQSKIDEYVQKIYSWDADAPGAYNITYKNTDIAFSPNVVAGNILSYNLPGFFNRDKRKDAFTISLITKYVGKQYLDNSQSELRKLDAYLINDLRLSYSLENYGLKKLSVNFIVRNLFDQDYISKGWVYRFRHPDQSWGPATNGSIYNVKDTEINDQDTPNDQHYFQKGLFAQAKINFSLGLSFRF